MNSGHNNNANFKREIMVPHLLHIPFLLFFNIIYSFLPFTYFISHIPVDPNSNLLFIDRASVDIMNPLLHLLYLLQWLPVTITAKSRIVMVRKTMHYVAPVYFNLLSFHSCVHRQHISDTSLSFLKYI